MVRSFSMSVPTLKQFDLLECTALAEPDPAKAGHFKLSCLQRACVKH